MKLKLCILVSAVLLAACAAPGQEQLLVPVMDLRGVTDQGRLYRDLLDCNQLAQQRMNAMQGAGTGALFGALLGAALGAAAGGHGQYIGSSAAVGAISGGVGGAGSAGMNQHAIVSRCMGGRGYMVLD
jgi:outer membrane lipoprotein SlyB